MITHYARAKAGECARLRRKGASPAGLAVANLMLAAGGVLLLLSGGLGLLGGPDPLISDVVHLGLCLEGLAFLADGAIGVGAAWKHLSG
jgi:hypothetical protein